MLLRTNYHTHTARCHHARGTDREYVECAIEAGLRILGFADHMPWPGDPPAIQSSRMRMCELEDYFTALTDLKKEYSGQIEIHIGMETENFDLLDEQLKNLEDYPCEYLLLGHHYTGYREGNHYFGRPFDAPDLLENYVSHVLDAIASGRFLYVAHPDLPKFQGDPTLLTAAYRRICAAAKQAQIPLEVNTLGLRDGRNYPNKTFFRIAAEYGCTLCVGVDAHSPRQLKDEESINGAYQFAHSFDLPVVEEFDLGVSKLR